ncbi:cache domain-containing sensor histidine kinase [Paenibacillus soyae]|uniref:histidine kinase n=1 Tax=Paenibacillus soyae TaxID=2969249 RepID=A0A9X2S990_9BACL|nr:sensor histidine kinase [Paenibacillus soyae]MCR2805219.1 sensor histidine kinase [Paenibacillus soyae]
MKIRKPFHTIRQKLMLLLLAATILPIAVSMVISYQATTRSLTEDAIANNTRLLSLGKANVTNYMNNINQKSLAVYNSMNTPRSLYYILEHGMEDEVIPNDLTDVIRNRNLLKDHLYNMYQSVSEFHKVRLYVVKQSTTYLLWKDDLKVGKHAEPVELTAAKAYLEPSHPSHNYGLDLNTGAEDETVFTLHRPIFRAPSEERLAELSIDIRLNVLRELNRELYDAGHEQFYITDASGGLILSSDEEAEKQGPSSALMQAVLGSGSDSGHLDWQADGFDGIIFYEKVSTSFMDWVLIKQTPYKHLYSSADRIARLNMAVGAGFLSIVVIATLVISIRITKPLLRLIGYVNKIETGNLSVNIDVEGNDEIGLLAKRFRSMMAKINHLIKTEYQLEIVSKTNELKALQAQINPHFLYNALQSIGTVSLQNGDFKAYSLIASLGRMMRYQMNTAGGVVELSRELDYASAYLDLQKQRFDTALDVEWRVEEESKTVLVPKMILQPLLENFFKHGFMQSGEPTRLVVSSTIVREPDLLVLEVSDNGSGVTDERLAELQKQLDEPLASLASDTSEDGGIGLRNVLARLQLHHSPDASMRVARSEDNGFTVSIQIPITSEEGNRDEGSDH